MTESGACHSSADPFAHPEFRDELTIAVNTMHLRRRS
jgi:hypothetical protein